MKTKKLNNGQIVLASGTGKYPESALQYANRTQAERKVIEMQARGYDAFVVHGMMRPFYVGIKVAEKEL